MSAGTDFIPLNLCVLTVSDTRTAENDTSGDYLADALRAEGHVLHERAIVRDDKYALRALVSAFADDLTELKTICHCGRKATMNLRLDKLGRALREGAQIDIGGNDRYVAVCRRHFKEALAGGLVTPPVTPVYQSASPFANKP